MDFVFDWALGVEGDLWATADIRVRMLQAKESDHLLRQRLSPSLVQSNNTEATCTGYSPEYQLAGESRTVDDTNNWVSFDANNYAFGVLGGATNNTIIGLWTYRWVSTLANSRNVSWHVTNFTTAGTAVTVEWNAGGVWRAYG